MINLSKVINDSAFTTRTSHQLEVSLQQKIMELQESQKCGNYVKADELKASIQKLKRDLNEKKLQQMIQTQKKEKQKLENLNQEEIVNLNANWNKKMSDFNSQKDKLKQQMQQRHQLQITKAKLQLEAQTPTRMKQSSECLNLRKIEEQMKRQKKYHEAHQIQQQIIEMEIKEKVNFEKQRQLKIQTALGTLKIKLKTELEALRKKVSTGEKQLIKEREKQIQKAKLKHANSIKQLVSQQEKQLLGEKGQIKSRVMLSSCRSRSKFTSLRKN